MDIRKIAGNREVAQKLRVPTSRVEDFSLVPKKCPRNSQQPGTPNLGVFNASGLRGTHAHAQTHKLE